MAFKRKLAQTRARGGTKSRQVHRRTNVMSHWVLIRVRTFGQRVGHAGDLDAAANSA
jgi:hypothetical protein